LFPADSRAVNPSDETSSPLDELLIGDILGEAAPDASRKLETEFVPEPAALRLSPKERFARIKREQALADVVTDPPAKGESIHILSGSKFDYWTWVPHMLGWLGGRADALYCSTWTLSRPNAVELLQLWDKGCFDDVAFLTGLYFKRRETAVYSFLLEGIQSRRGRYRALLNHAKVLLLHSAKRRMWLTVEGSANLTANPRLEQYVVTNCHELWQFHRAWMEEALTR
jgi:hypothetical protein